MTTAADAPPYLELTEELADIRTVTVRGGLAPARGRLESLRQRFPRSGQVRQEIGDVHLLAGDRANALDAYRAAVELNDALPHSWRALEELYRAAHRDAEAREAARCASYFEGLPPPLLQACVLLNEGQRDAAEELTRNFLQQNGAHAEGMRLLARICVQANVLDDAEMLLDHVLQEKPGYDDARFEFAVVLAERRRYAAALSELTPLLERDPASVDYRKLYARICDGLGKSEQALATLRALWSQAPSDEEPPLTMARILHSTGATAEATRMYTQVLSSPKGFARACLALSNLKRFDFSEEQLLRMRSVEADPSTGNDARAQLCFALGTAMQARKRFEESFEYYLRGNALKRAELSANPEPIIRAMRRQPDVCTAEFFAARRRFGCPAHDPVFIVGMPRAGSTLIEQILASHSQIDGTLELPDIPRLVHQFRDRVSGEPPRYPAILRDLTAEECRRMGEIYLEDTSLHRRGAPYFLDKMPQNFRDIGFIHLILPNARFIDARREPIACCFGNFKQLFGGVMEFKYRLEDLGRYYCEYVKLMEHWDKVLPGRILRVDHEDVVNDLEASVRRMLDFLGLPFEPACLEFHSTQRTVRTLSADQVRRPINREGFEQWRPYEPWLGPLKEALAPLRTL